MALEERIRTVGCLSHDALVAIDKRVADILRRQREEILERRKAEFSGMPTMIRRRRRDGTSTGRTRGEGGPSDPARARRASGEGATAASGAPSPGGA